MRILLILLAAAAVFFIAVMIRDNHRFVVRRYTVHSAKVSRRLTFVFVSDLHSKDYGGDNRKVVQAIEDLSPDAVLCAGDLIIKRYAWNNKPGWIDTGASFVRQIAVHFPFYLTDGNHEEKLCYRGERQEAYDDWCKAVKSAGAVKLHNQCVDCEGGVRITGLDLPRETYQKIKPYHMPEGMVEDCIGRCDPTKFNLVIAHNPKFFREYAEWGADLVVSGHVHGGLMRIGRLGMIGPDLHLFPRYSGGLYENRETGAHMVVTCGLGAHTLPIRIFNPGEISYIEILPEKA